MKRLADGDDGLLELDGIGPKSVVEIKQRVGSSNLRDTRTGSQAGLALESEDWDEEE